MALVVAAAFLGVVAWVALASGPAETGRDRIEVTSPGDVATLEGGLRRP